MDSFFYDYGCLIFVALFFLATVVCFMAALTSGWAAFGLLPYVLGLKWLSNKCSEEDVLR